MVGRRDKAADLLKVGIVVGPRVIEDARRDKSDSSGPFRAAEGLAERRPAASAMTDGDCLPDAEVIEHCSQVLEAGERP